MGNQSSSNLPVNGAKSSTAPISVEGTPAAVLFRDPNYTTPSTPTTENIARTRDSHVNYGSNFTPTLPKFQTVPSRSATPSAAFTLAGKQFQLKLPNSSGTLPQYGPGYLPASPIGGAVNTSVTRGGLSAKATLHSIRPTKVRLEPRIPVVTVASARPVPNGTSALPNSSSNDLDQTNNFQSPLHRFLKEQTAPTPTSSRKRYGTDMGSLLDGSLFNLTAPDNSLFTSGPSKMAKLNVSANVPLSQPSLTNGHQSIAVGTEQNADSGQPAAKKPRYRMFMADAPVSVSSTNEALSTRSLGFPPPANVNGPSYISSTVNGDTSVAPHAAKLPTTSYDSVTASFSSSRRYHLKQLQLIRQNTSSNSSSAASSSTTTVVRKNVSTPNTDDTPVPVVSIDKIDKVETSESVQSVSCASTISQAIVIRPISVSGEVAAVKESAVTNSGTFLTPRRMKRDAQTALNSLDSNPVTMEQFLDDQQQQQKRLFDQLNSATPDRSLASSFEPSAAALQTSCVSTSGSTAALQTSKAAAVDFKTTFSAQPLEFINSTPLHKPPAQVASSVTSDKPIISTALISASASPPATSTIIRAFSLPAPVSTSSSAPVTVTSAAVSSNNCTSSIAAPTFAAPLLATQTSVQLATASSSTLSTSTPSVVPATTSSTATLNQFSFSFGATTSTSRGDLGAATTSSFSFGAPAFASISAPATSVAPTASIVNSLLPSVPLPKLSFPDISSSAAPVVSTASGGFSFSKPDALANQADKSGSTVATTSLVKPLFTFSPSSTLATTTGTGLTNPVLSTITFTATQPLLPISTVAAMNPTQAVTTTTSSAPFSFGVSSTSTNFGSSVFGDSIKGFAAPAITGGFGAAPAPAVPATSSATFNSLVSTQSTTSFSFAPPANSLFSAASGSSAFGQPNVSAPTTTAASGAAFASPFASGLQTTSSSLFGSFGSGQQSSQTAVSLSNGLLGLPGSQMSKSQSSPSFNFGAAGASPFGSVSTPAVSSCNVTTTTQAPISSASPFGSLFAAAPANSRLMPTNASASSSTGSLFGASAPSPFQFGSTATTTTPAAAPAPVPASLSQASAFSFGSTPSTAAPTTTSLFSATASSTSAFSGFGSPQNTFGSSTQPVFGMSTANPSQSGGAFNFMAPINSSAPASGFSFATPTPGSGFSFGAPAAAPSTGFNFSSPASSSSSGVGGAPSAVFNFSAGPSPQANAFSMVSAGDGATSRKTIHAKRRAAPRK